MNEPQPDQEGCASGLLKALLLMILCTVLAIGFIAFAIIFLEPQMFQR